MDIATALRAFIRTVERGSVTAAARDLNLSQPGVTKHLRNLERHVGARLLERSARTVRPTAQGQILYDASREALTTIDAALEGVRRDMGEIEGHLRVHAPSCIGARHLHKILMAFQRQYPAVTADLILDNRDVDLVYENFDIAIKYGRPAHQDLIIRRFGSIRRILVAAPNFLECNGSIDSLDGLSRAGVIASNRSLSARDIHNREGETFDIPIRPVLRTNSAEVIASTLLEGYAVGPVQLLLVATELAEGSLIHILQDYEVAPTEAIIAYPSIRFMRPVVRAFSEFAIEHLNSLEGITQRPQLQEGQNAEHSSGILIQAAE
jgi:DNA-binding transcriptional LysR family regulator